MQLPDEPGSWRFIQDSFSESFLPGHESPYDELSLGRARVDDPSGVFATLDSISGELRKLVDSIDDPSRFYPALLQQVPTILEDSRLPQKVRVLIYQLVKGVIQDVKTLYSHRELPESESVDAIAYRVFTDVREISWVPLNDDEVLDEIQVESISLNEIPGITELLPELEKLGDNAGTKGGAARVALKLHVLQNMDLTSPAGEALLASFCAEFPLADLDLVLTQTGPDVLTFAKEMGVHPIDIEGIADFSTGTLIDHFGRRDLCSNQALLTKNKLFFTRKAKEEMERNPGEAQSIVPTIPGLFGRECFYVNKRLYLAANTLYRLVKMVAEEKNTHFIAPQYNFDAIAMGKYWPTLIRKWLKRPDRARVFSRAYMCARKMGTTDAQTPAEFFNDLMEQNLDFDFFGQQTTLDATKWLLKKYIIFLEKILRRKFGLHPERVGEIFASDDTTLIKVEADISSIPAADFVEVENLFAQLERQRPIRAEEEDQPQGASQGNSQAVLRVLQSLLYKQADQFRQKAEIIQNAQARSPQSMERITSPRFQRRVYLRESREGFVYFDESDSNGYSTYRVPANALQASCTYNKDADTRYSVYWILPDSIEPEFVKRYDLYHRLQQGSWGE